jgi:hypothetical protein
MQGKGVKANKSLGLSKFPQNCGKVAAAGLGMICLTLCTFDAAHMDSIRHPSVAG